MLILSWPLYGEELCHPFWVDLGPSVFRVLSWVLALWQQVMDLQLELLHFPLETAHSVPNTHSAAEELVDRSHTHHNDENLPHGDDEQDSHAMAGSILAEELCGAESEGVGNSPNLDENIPTAAV